MPDTDRDSLIEGSKQGQRFSLLPPPAVPQGVVGSRLGNRPGSSLEFMDHRAYQVGDDLRRIDWNAYARSDKLTVKLYREEVNPHLDILMDGSSSMALANSQKSSATLALASAFSAAAANSHFTWTCHCLTERCHELPNGSQPAPLWHPPAFDYAGTPEQAMHSGALRLRARGMRFFISDLLWLGEPEALLARLCQNAGSVCIIQLLAQADISPPSHGNLRLVDSETREILEVFVDSAVQQQYRQRLNEHQEHWHNACRHLGATLVTLVAEDLLTHWNLEALLEKEILEVK